MKQQLIYKRLALFLFCLLPVSYSSYCQETYLFHPFYRDGISDVGASFNGFVKHNISKSTPNVPTDYAYYGMSLLPGIVANAHFNYGIGLHWGLHLFDYSILIEQPWGTKYFGFELSLYHTLHIDFKLPLSNYFALGVHTGPGLTFSYYGDISEYRNDFNPFKEKMLKRYDFSYDCVAYIEYIRYRIEISWTKGLTDHYGLYRRDKVMIGLVYFGFK